MEKTLQTKTNKVLVVEAEPAIRKIFKLALGAEGFQVDTAENAGIALNILRRTEYDPCLMEIRTLLMNGIELYRHLEDESSEVVNRVIFTTGDAMNSEVMAFLAKTNRPFLLKPFTVDELKTIVGTTLGFESGCSQSKCPVQERGGQLVRHEGILI